MVDKLLGLLQNEFAAPSKITTYYSFERICLNLAKKHKTRQVTPDTITQVAKKTFTDIAHEVTSKGDWGLGLYFDVNIQNAKDIDDFRRIDNYSGHNFLLDDLAVGDITVSIGNRGTSGLFTKQREQYFCFIKELYKLI